MVALEVGITDFTLKVLQHLNFLVHYLDALFFLTYHILFFLLTLEGSIVLKVQRCNEGYCHDIFHLGTHVMID
jgi:hypothetical protein